MHIGQQHHRALPDLPIQPSLGQLLAGDGVGLTQGLQTFAGDLADDADAQTRAREGLTPDDLVRQAQLGADGPDLVLEEGAQGLDQLELDVLGQTTHVVVGLDIGRSVSTARLDHVRVERALHQELDFLAGLAGLLNHLPLGLFKGADELLPNDLALTLRLGNALEGGQEVLRGIHGDQLDARSGHKIMLDLFGLPLTQQAMIHEDAGQLVTDGPVDQSGRHG